MKNTILKIKKFAKCYYETRVVNLGRQEILYLSSRTLISKFLANI